MTGAGRRAGQPGVNVPGPLVPVPAADTRSDKGDLWFTEDEFFSYCLGEDDNLDLDEVAMVRPGRRR